MHSVRTLAELPEAIATSFPTRTVRTFFEGDAWPSPFLLRRTNGVAAGLRERGVGPGDLVGVLLSNSLQLLAIYLGVFRAGAILAPLAVPAGWKNVDAALARLRHIVADGGIRHLVTEPEIASLVGQAGVDVDVMTPDALIAIDSPPPPIAVGGDDLALVQYTSGSTASPKGVALTHAQVLAGIEAIISVARITADDIYCMWLPMSHDMGLVSTLAMLLAGAEVHLSTPSTFIKRPGAWLAYFARARGTISTGPSFSFRYLMEGVDQELLATLDLSSWRIALNGAEMIDPHLLERFITCFAPAGFRPEAVYPAYGLAEATLAVSLPDPGEPTVIEWVDGTALANHLDVRYVARDDPRARGVVAVGRPVKGLEVRIAGPEGVLGERRIGEIEVRGASVMSGYYRHPDETREAFHDGWLRTGDLGYLSGGRLFVTGRIKELMKVRGEGYFPEDLEGLVLDLEGVYRNRCIAFALLGGPSERLAVLLETDLTDPEGQARLVLEARRRLASRLDPESFDVHLVAPRSIPRTTSGKYQRLLMRDRLQAGAVTLLGGS